MDHVAQLTDALDAPLPLLEARRIPGYVDVHLAAMTLQVEAFAGGVGSDQETNVLVLDFFRSPQTWWS
jgi:hypothetical protein